MVARRHWLLGLVAAGSLSCAESAQFNVRLAPEFGPARAPVSMFGVFRDGRMSPESWALMEPALAAALGAESCEAIYAARTRAPVPLLARADEYTRNNGITDELLEKFAPHAGGDLIMTISVTGKAEMPSGDDIDLAQPTGGMPPARGVAPRQPQKRRSGRARAAPRGLEISASFYSIKLHRSVGRVSMKYAGPSVEDAVQRFAAQVAELLPGSTCRPWNLGDSGVGEMAP